MSFHNARSRFFSIVVSLSILAALTAASSADASFGIVPGSLHADALNSDGTVDVQAGSHPYVYTVSFAFNHDAEGNADGSVRDVVVDLPPGLAGNPIATPRCPRQDLEGIQATCPGNTQIGTFSVVSRDPATKSGLSPAGPVFNLVPPKGVAASLGFAAAGFNAIQNVGVAKRDGAERVSVTSSDLPLGHIVSVSVTIWGVPAESSHDAQRQCVGPKGEVIQGCATDASVRPFLTLPTACSGPLTTVLEADSTEFPDAFLTESALSRDVGGNPIGPSGCEALDFRPSIVVQPETSAAASPSGVHVDVHLPQDESVGGRAEAQLRSTTVTLPAGLVVNPSSANGLQSCSPAQIELEGTRPPQCPAASQIGTVEVDTPVLDHALPGSVYLAAQNDNPFNSLVAIYVVVNDPVSGVVVKLAGHVEPDPVTGQLRTTFVNLPQLPFEDVKLDLSGGPRAPLMTPDICSTASTLAAMMPWSRPEGQGTTTIGSSFQVLSGPGGSACAFSAGEEPNRPAFEAGTVVPLAGGYGPLVLKLTREDGSQNLDSLSITMPPGVTGRLAGIPRCTDAEIGAAELPGRTGAAEQSSSSCPSASRVGTVTTGLGAGSSPFYISAPVYLAGPYKGAPFSLAVIVPALAGPFDLGVVVVRSALYVNPETAQVTAKTDPLPRILYGFPTDIRSATVVLDKHEFILNPTSCEPMAINGEAISTIGQAVPLSARFQAGGCKGLPFTPTFTAVTQAKTSKLNGASLTIKVTQKPGEANIHKVTLQLPLSFPARLTTLQKACLAAQFAVNPADCPEAAVIGTARAVTPILNVPLTGPAYLVSHGGARFPDVVFILQGEGVTVDVVSHTDIKKGITYSHLETVPDAPVSSFEAVLPEGPHSIFTAFGKLCSKALTMIVTSTGQNGVPFKHNTTIAVAGCPRPTIRVRKAQARARGVSLTLTTSQPGTVSVTSGSLKSLRTAIPAGTRRLMIPYSGRGRQLHRRHSGVRLQVRLNTPSGTKHTTVTLKL